MVLVVSIDTLLVFFHDFSYNGVYFFDSFKHGPFSTQSQIGLSLFSISEEAETNDGAIDVNFHLFK